MAAKKGGDDKAPIIIKKKKGGHGHGHHGGAWKVAYADFVTAMMAFFLLMWLLNATSQEQRIGIANYFTPITVTKVSISGSGGVLGGTSMSPEGAMKEDNVQPTVSSSVTPPQDIVEGDENQYASEHGTSKEQKEEIKDPQAQAKVDELVAKSEARDFKKVEDNIRAAIQEDEELQKLADNLLIQRTPEGLRIQIIDNDKVEMFPVGSTRMYDYTTKLLQKVTQLILPLPNKLSISGHTDSRTYPAGALYTNWELSSDRANAARRVMSDAGLPPERVNVVVGRADREHLLPNDPLSPKNRRLSIILLTETKNEGFRTLSRNPLDTVNPLFEKKQLPSAPPAPAR
ncbi:MAG: flagellar motor protein MotB [Dongiaceae bacterium]